MLIKDIMVHADGPFSENLDATLVPGDKKAYRIVYKTPYDLAGTMFQVTARREDGAVIQDTGITQEKNAFYVLKNNMYALEGHLQLRLTINSQGGSVLTQKEVILPVAPYFEEPDLSADDRTPALSNLITQTMQASSSAKLNGDYAKEQGDYAGEQGLAAENAAGYAQEKADEVAAKLAAGEFIGPKGETGPQGPKGEKGEKGDKGDPGNMVTVTDNLTSTSTTAALSANQGRVLKTAVDGKLAPSNIHAGNNVTVTVNGKDITIAASGGGGEIQEITDVNAPLKEGAYSINLEHLTAAERASLPEYMQQEEGGGTLIVSGGTGYQIQILTADGTPRGDGPMWIREALYGSNPYDWKDFDVYNLTNVVDNLMTQSETDPLSANQGYILKGLIDIKADSSTRNGGFAGGDGASGGDGGAVGLGANSSGGLAGGVMSRSGNGGAAGMEAKTSDGFAGGAHAKAVDSNNNGIDAIQLGTGTNNTPKTLQVYGYQMLDAAGKIPEERLPEQSGAGGFVLRISFQYVLTSLAGQPFSVEANGFSYSGTVPGNLTADVTVSEPNTEYTIICNNADTQTVTTQNYFGIYPVTVNESHPTLEEASWNHIAEVSALGKASQIWSVGDTKTIMVNGTAQNFVIIDFDHDDLTNGTGKAGITFGFKNKILASRQMNSTNTNVGSFTGSTMYAYLQNTVLPSLPSDLRTVIKSVNKKTTEGNKSYTIKTEAMKLFLFAEPELFGPNGGNYGSSDEGTQYPYYEVSGNRWFKTANGSSTSWWERSPNATGSTSFCYVNGTGNASSSYASTQYGINFGFCV